MADHCSLSLLTIMDRLWFHQIILFPSDCSSSTPLQTLPSNLQHQHETSTTEKEEESPTRINPASTVGSRRSESSPTNQRRQENIKRSSSKREVDSNYSTISCRSFRELEMEEVKGFIDLGFKFDKQNMNPRIARIIPGLLKFLDSSFTDEDEEKQKEDDDYEEEEEEGGEKGIIRPYLSEAWLVNRRNSPLLNFNLPLGRVSASATSDMKKHLKFWARNVACVIHQQS